MKLLTVDVEAPLPDVPPPSVGEQWVLVRVHREPVGILKFAGRGCTRAELAGRITSELSPRIVRHLVADALDPGPPALLEWLDRIPRVCPRHAATELPSLTVAVCTRAGADRLRDCLDSLVALDYPSERLELLVVDNAPVDASTQTLVRDDYPSVRYLVEPRPGLNWARNRAVLDAGGELLAYTDDDVSVDPGWAAAFGRLFAEDAEVDAATGLIVPDEIDVEAQRLFEDYGGFGRGFNRQYFRVHETSSRSAAAQFGGTGRFGAGANMCFRRSLFDRIGLFDPALDVGTPTNGGGDLEMFFRVLKEHGTLVYEPCAVVRHRHRKTYEALRAQIANNGVGFYAYLARTAAAYPDERAALVRLGIWWLWWWNLRRLGRSLIRPGEFPRDLILAELRGSLAGGRRYAPSVRQAARTIAPFGEQRPGETLERAGR